MEKQIKKRVLYITYFFPPTGGGGVQRPLKTVKYLSKMGWSIDVLTTKDANYDVFDDSLLQEIPSENENFRLIRVTPGKVRKRTAPAQPAKGLKTISKKKRILKKLAELAFELLHVIPDKQFTWASRGFKQAVDHYKRFNIKPDVIYSTALPISCHFVAKRLSEYFNVPWVAEYRDLWNDKHYHKRLLPTKALVDEFLERNLLKKVQHIIVVVPHFKRILSKKYPWLEGAVSVIPNGYDKEDFSKDVITKKQRHKFTIIYTGRIYESRNIAPLLDAIRQGIQNKDWTEDTLQVVFYGPMLPKTYMDMIHSYGLHDIVRHEGYLSHMQSIEALLASDYLLLIEGSASAFTGKVWEYMATEKPILAVLPENSDLIVELQAYGAADISDFNTITIYNSIKERFNDWQQNKPWRGINREYLFSRTREAQAKEIGKILKGEMKST